MAEYIEREALEKTLNERLTYLMDKNGPYDYFTDGYDEAVSIVEEFLSADVAPVVHGRWEWLGPNRLVPDCMCGTCSACKVRSKYIVNTMLCPNCGAKMEVGAE